MPTTFKKPFIALAMIVKNDPKEFKLLERCLKSLDGAYDDDEGSDTG